MSDWRLGGGNRRYTWELTVSVLIVAAAAAGCSRYPISSVAGAENANQQALQAGAPRYAPTEYQSYQETMESARALLAEQEQRWLFRRYGSAASLFEEARQMAEAAAAKATVERLSQRLAVEAELHRFEESLQMAHDGGAQIARAALMRRSLMKATISLETARSQWQAGDYDAASNTLESEAEALRFLDDVGGAFTRRNGDPDLLSDWNKAVKATIADSARTGGHAIIVNKYRRTLTLYHDGRRVAEYAADLGANPFSEKRERGDKATPEGRYHVTNKLGAGQSRYYKALVIDYPNAEDRRRYRLLNGRRPSTSELGSHIEIHGRGGRDENWTLGCIAVEDRVMDRLFAVAKVGLPVTIVANETIQPAGDAGSGN